jgi:hypothetical protein
MTELIDPEDSELSDFVVESTCCNGGLTSHLACFSKLKILLAVMVAVVK